MAHTQDMTQGKPLGLIVRFALPLMLGNIGQQLYTVVDAIIVGRGVGVQALAALGATDWLYWLGLWIVMSFAQGFSILITQRFGAKDEDGLKRAIAISIRLCIVIGLTATVLGLVFARPLLALLQTPEDIFASAGVYLTTLYAGLGVVLAYNMAASVLRALGNSKTPLAAMFIAALTNIALDLLFVMVLGWGIAGAAVATIIAQFVSFLYCVFVLLKIPQARFGRQHWKWDAAVAKQLLRLGLPLAAQHGFITIGGMILQSVINGYGFVFVAGFTATNKLYGLLESTATSFGFANSTYIGQNHGARHLERIEDGVKLMVRLAVCVSVAIGLGVAVFGKPLLALFVSSGEASGPEVLNIAYQYLLHMCVCLPALYILYAYRSTLLGLGNTISSLVSGFIEFAMRVGIAVILPPLLGRYVLFYVEPAAWIGAAVYLIVCYYRQIPKIRMELRAAPPGQKRGTP